MQVREGTRLGGYRVLRKIGEGGMGAVFEGVHERLQKRVAIKTLHEQFARDASSVARFTREGRAASRIRHGHVIDVTDVGMEDGTPYLVMELLEGESLAGLIKRVGPLPTDAIADIALPVLDALEAAHAAGIVHRDLKPENVFLTRSRSGTDAHPMVLDFGISCIEDEVRMTKTAHFMGTPHYMSPEQAQSARSVDGRSDQFSLGLVLFELVTGRRALTGDSVLEVVHRVSTEGAIRLSVVRRDLPPAFTAIIDRMTERDPAQRFASMREVGMALLPFASPRAQALWGQAFQRPGGVALRSSVPLLEPRPSAPSTPSSSGIHVSLPSSFGTQDAPRASFTPASTPMRSQPPPAASFSQAGPRLPSTRPFSPPSQSTPRGSGVPGSARMATDPTVDASARTPRSSEIPARPAPRSPVLLAVLAVASVLGAVGIAFVVGTTLAHRQQDALATTTAAPPTSVAVDAPPTSLTTPAPPTSVAASVDIRLRAIPATAEIVLDGTVVGTGTYAGSLVRDGIPHLLEVRQDGFIPHDIQFLDIAPIATITLERVPSHHHGPIEARHFAMTASGLVNTTEPATAAMLAAPPATTLPVPATTAVVPTPGVPTVGAAVAGGTTPTTPHESGAMGGPGSGTGIVPPPSTAAPAPTTVEATSAPAHDEWGAPQDDLEPFDG